MTYVNTKCIEETNIYNFFLFCSEIPMERKMLSMDMVGITMDRMEITMDTVGTTMVEL